MFPNEVAKKFFVHSSLVDDLKNRFSTLRADFWISLLTAVSQKVQPSSIALSNTGSASSRDRSDPKPKLKPMAPKPGTGTWTPRKLAVWTIFATDCVGPFDLYCVSAVVAADVVIDVAGVTEQTNDTVCLYTR